MQNDPDRVYQGQPYWRVGQKEHTTKKGQEMMLTVWRSLCAECGEPFKFTAPTREKFMPNRRCDLHKKPGVKVLTNV